MRIDLRRKTTEEKYAVVVGERIFDVHIKWFAFRPNDKWSHVVIESMEDGTKKDYGQGTAATRIGALMNAEYQIETLTRKTVKS